MGHQQGPTPIKTGNAAAQGILTGSMEAKYLTGAGMRLNWVEDRVEQGQHGACWGPAATNLADYPAKHHPPTHHRTVRPICTHQAEHSPTTMQGCVNALEGLAATRHESPADKPKPGETAASLPALHAPLRREASLPASLHREASLPASLHEEASLPSLRSSPHGREARKLHCRGNPPHAKRLAPRVSRVHAITRER